MQVKKETSVLSSGKPTAVQLEAINAQAKGTLTEDQVYVFSLRLCDDQVDRDYERFDTAALPELAKLFIGKTGIVDHRWSTEGQVARIFETQVVCEEGISYLKAWAYIRRGGNADEVIADIEAGIKKEVSIGCAMGRSVCSVCGSEITDWGDGTYDVVDYDESGATIRHSSFSKGGELLQEYIYEREYDSDGNLVTENIYLDGVLNTENHYTTDENGNWYSGYTDHYEDGTYAVVDYNLDGEIIHNQFFNADDSLEYETFTEYAYTDDGESYEAVYSTISSDGSRDRSEYNQYGDPVLQESWLADGSLDRTKRYEYDYNEDGDRLWVKEYLNDALVYEVLNFAEGSDGDGSFWRYPENTIDYYEDGSKLVIHCDEYGAVETETHYAADGSVEREMRYTYEYDDEGNVTRGFVYENDRLTMETEYALSADGWSYKCRETEYFGEGAKTVREYDESEELISEISYGKG